MLDQFTEAPVQTKWIVGNQPPGQPSAARISSVRKDSNRKWFDVHSWFGVLSGLILFIICWSGSFATISNELDWLVTPAMRVTPAGAPADLTAIHDVVAARMPGVTISSVNDPLHPRFAADVVVETGEDELRRVYVDPYSLEITGEASYLNLQRFFRDFHMNFFGLLGWGKYVVTIFAVPLVASLITALVFYKRWWRRFFSVRAGKGAKALWSSLHKAAGLWSMWFVLLIGITSLWYLFEEVRSDALDKKFSYVEPSALAVHPLPKIEVADADKLPFGELMERARSAAPDLDINSASPDRGGYFYVEGSTGAVLVRDRANKMYLDPRDGRLAHYQKADDLSAYWRWSEMADPLHFGDFGGLATKFIWFAFGLLLSGICLTGGWLHMKRLRRNRVGNVRWRGTLAAGAAGIGLFLFCIGAAIFSATGVGWQLVPGVVAGVTTWAIVTAGICAWWIRAMIAPTKPDGEARRLVR